MPLVRISVIRGKPAAPLRKVGDAVHRAFVETVDVPEKDRFQVVSEHGRDELCTRTISGSPAPTASC